MASVIRIKRSLTSVGAPNLAAGELAYSGGTGTQSNGGDRLYFGQGPEVSGIATTYVIGGKYFTDMLDHAHGTVTASSAVIVDSSKKVDEWNVDNISIDGNTITSTDANGNIILDPNGTGYVSVVGTNGLVIPVGTTAQRAPNVQGTIRYNTETSSFEGYSGTNWGSLGGVRSVDGYTYIVGENTPGGSDGIIHFFAENAAGTAATEVAQLDRTKLALLQTTASTSSSTGALTVAGGVGIAGDLYVGGNLNITGTNLNIGSVTFNNGLTLSGSTTAATEYFRITDGAGTPVTKFLVDTATGNTTISGTLGVTGAATLSSTLAVTDAATLSSTLGVTGATTLSSTLGVTGATTLSSTLAVTGATTLSSTLNAGASTLASASVTGNATVGGTLGVTGATTLSSTLGVTGATTLSSTLAVTGASTFTGATTHNGGLTVGASQSISMGSNRVQNVADPTQAQDAATKAYVDAVRTGLDVKDSARVATTANITLSNTQTVDGVALAVNDRVLVKDQTTASQNGVYIVQSGAWTRASDFDNSPNVEVTSGAFIFVEEGTVNSDSGWVLTTDGTITLGTTGLTFVQFSGAGQIVAGAALTKTGNTLDVAVDNTTIEVDSDALRIKTTYAGQSSITTLGTVTTGTWNASVISPVYGGSGVANNAAATVTSVGNFAYTRTLTGATNVTFPTTGTLATLAGAETLSNKTIAGATISGNLIPDTNVAYDLGSATYAFRDLYLSGSSIKLGTATLTASGTGLGVASLTSGGNVTGAGASTSTLDGFNIDGGTY